VIAALAATEKTDKALIDAAARELGICRAYCYRLLRRYREDASVTRLMPQARGRVVGAKVLDPAIETLIEAAINGVGALGRCGDGRVLIPFWF
jgi:putative transposase